MTPFDYKRQQNKQIRRMSEDAALSSGLTSGLTGAGFGAFQQKNLKDVLKIALKSGLIGAGVGGGSIYAGAHLLGMPEENETTGYTRRGTVGGTAVGAGLGAALGAGLGSGVMPKPGNKTVMSRLLSRLARNPGPKNMATGAAILGPIGALVGGYMGSDEGLVLDFIDQERKQAMKRQAQRQLYNE
jgi:hypothetical protein